MQNNYLQKLSENYQVGQILKTNETSKENGLTLTEEEAKDLVAARGDTLREERRVEFGDSISPKLIRTFADSSFINQEDYVQTLARLQEIFFRNIDMYNHLLQIYFPYKKAVPNRELLFCNLILLC